ncbi:MAG TPA: 1-deoxy-D-xylulose-5-phosphate reductoisomerase, partial [Rhizomicrobium sp.]
DLFPCLKLALDVMKAGGHAPTILNAANEIAVGAFLKGRIGFLDIARCVDETLQADVQSGANTAPDSLEMVLDTDARARVAADQACVRFG